MPETTRADLRTVADYQFGASEEQSSSGSRLSAGYSAGDALFGPAVELEVTYSTGGRPSQLHAPDGRLASMGTDGRFTLGFAGGLRLQESLPEPAYRVVVGDESEPFLREGRNTFAKFVQEADPEIRPEDEVLVVHEDGSLLAVGRAELAAEAMLDFDTGMAVKVREGADEYAQTDADD